MSKKSADLIQPIIEAKNEKDAIAVIHKTLEYLYLTDNYVSLMALKDTLEGHKRTFEGIEKEYRSLSFPRKYEDLAALRDEVAFLYRAVNDDLSYDVNSAKIRFGEDAKSSFRAEAIISAKKNEELLATNNGKQLSLSSLDRIYGGEDSYKEYLNLYSVSYGTYQELIAFFAAMNRLSDSIASQAAHALTILNRDVK